MGFPLISVIIPVYNVDTYLETCVDSVLGQSYKNLDVILVDDGSTDLSSSICDEYKKNDKRVQVIHKTNGGLSDARNYGIDIAKGIYITFVDSDDFVSVDYIDTLFKLISENNADISICKNIKFSEDEENIQLKAKNNKEIICFNNLMAMQDLFYQKHIENSAWGKLYKSELFTNVRYPIGKLYEDMGTTYKLLYKARKVIWSSAEKYYYLQRENSIMNRKFSIRNMDRVIISEEILEFVKHNVPSIENAAISRAFISNVQVLREIPLTDKNYVKEIKSIKTNIQVYRKIVLMDKNAKKINRLIALSTYLPMDFIQSWGKIYKKIYK
ncbi:hypothetical protein GCM10008910_17620 [Faecalicatena orotica]|uniref:Glycosyl transferase family 2 n=1 Tax=Faecalicatena orotica TaxID=1544 RepID=A0A2Y9BAN9_9FIRM|nr:glycosyltransferase family 2 protein [Faecalicatena orotica]PWJ31994.1 glycosyl transferase family 2 [Faecalicatena orotica]SSA53822.1 Glycosyl transferase family 2 [Faecalicatena orotica]